MFRATKEQINQAQALLKSRGFYSGEQVGKLDDATREGLRKYQQAEGLKVTGTLNKVTLEKMNITLTENRKACNQKEVGRGSLGPLLPTNPIHETRISVLPTQQLFDDAITLFESGA